MHCVIKTQFVRIFRVDMEEAEKALEAYPTLSDLFIRKLKENARPIADSPVVSPVDGVVTQINRFSEPPLRLTQIKQKKYSFRELTGGDWREETFAGGWYGTFYLTPRHYHRIHAPVSGYINKIVHIPGRLWPVNKWSVEHISDLFSVNERLILEICDEKSIIIMAMVGATNVGEIHLTCLPGFHTNHPGRVQPKCFEHVRKNIKKGEEIGYFSMGSTVILIGNKESLESIKFHPQSRCDNNGSVNIPIKMGAPLLR